MIIVEFKYIINKLNMNCTIENALMDFALRSHLEDINNFAEVIITAKRTGGNLIKIIKVTNRTISDKIDVKREIKTIITSKQFEANIMKFIPIGIILYLWICTNGFLNILYNNILGIIIMTIILVVYYGCVKMIENITNIEV